MNNQQSTGVLLIVELMAAEYNVKFNTVKMNLWMDGLQAFPDQVIDRAIYAYLQDPDKGTYAPKLADIINLCAKMCPNATWITADEAWAKLPRSEDQSAMMTREMSEAWAVASQAGKDQNAQRMAFRATYDRLVDEAKVMGRLPSYFFSPGRDVAGRVAVLTNAVQLGLMKPEALPALLPPAETQSALVNAGVPKTHPLLAPPATPENKARVRALLQTMRSANMAKKLAQDGEGAQA